MYRILKPEGVFHLGMKEGHSEGLVESESYPGMQRFFALYSQEELLSLLSPFFNVFYTSKNPWGRANFLNFVSQTI